jgi:hypothetical protein
MYGGYPFATRKLVIPAKAGIHRKRDKREKEFFWRLAAALDGSPIGAPCGSLSGMTTN